MNAREFGNKQIAGWDAVANNNLSSQPIPQAHKTKDNGKLGPPLPGFLTIYLQ